ncbi:MAG: YitT family protein [Muribaculaceae bacterium]|nr:YitT family protein [Muribaculaceae bacterium]
MNTIKLWRSTRDYVFITFGVALYAFGFCGFILPEKVVTGGLAGVSTLIYLLTGIPVAVSNYALNLILLAMAYKIVGRKFVVGTIFGATMISLFIGIFQPLLAGGFTHEPFMNIVIGATLCGLGIGTTFVHNGSSGGTDIIAAMVSKKSNVTIGRTMLYVDCIIITSGYLIFHQIDKLVYGFVVMFFISYVADQVIYTNRRAVQFTIISRNWPEIADAIIHDAHRGCTVLNGTGWYSKQDVKVLLVMCRKIESVTISRIIKAIDPHAFVTQANVSGVYGHGFDELKVKITRKKPQEEAAPAPLPGDGKAAVRRSNTEE